MAKCSIGDCPKPAEARGWCSTHYMRWRKHGDPHTVLRTGRKKWRKDTCEVDGCDRGGRIIRGYCGCHYWRWQRYGDPLGGFTPLYGPVCSVDECDRDAAVRGFCHMHYSRWRVHGDPGPATPLMRPKGTGTITKDGYVKRRSGAVFQAEHRTVMEGVLGRRLTPSETVHHINGDKRDNRPENLDLWVSRHPKGQRVADLVEFATEILARYGSEVERLS